MTTGGCLCGAVRYEICAGTLAAPTGIREKAHIYTGSKGDYYEIASGLIEYDTFPNKR